MMKRIRKLILLFLLLMVSHANAWASNIDLFAQGAAHPVQFNPENSITISAFARGLGSYPYFIYDFDPDADFDLSATYNKDTGFYSGSLSVISPEPNLEILFSASFNQLRVFSYSYFGLSAIIFIVEDLLKTAGVLDVAVVEGQDLLAAGYEPFLGAFHGQIKGVMMAERVAPLTTVHHPEPATFILFGFGLLGLAGISRKKNHNST